MLKKILLSGVNGQVGHALKNQLLQFDVIALTRDQLDLSNTHNIRQVVRELKPNLIINPAAYTAVDKAESEPELAFAINGTAPQILAEEAARLMLPSSIFLQTMFTMAQRKLHILKLMMSIQSVFMVKVSF